MDKILENLNEEQRAAVLQKDGPILIIAGAGSGKTRVLTSKIALLLQVGVSPYEILALTFTKKAAGEMTSRIRSMVGENARGLAIGTFHSVFIRFLFCYSDSHFVKLDFQILVRWYNVLKNSSTDAATILFTSFLKFCDLRLSAILLDIIEDTSPFVIPLPSFMRLLVLITTLLIFLVCHLFQFVKQIAVLGERFLPVVKGILNLTYFAKVLI